MQHEATSGRGESGKCGGQSGGRETFRPAARLIQGEGGDGGGDQREDCELCRITPGWRAIRGTNGGQRGTRRTEKQREKHEEEAQSESDGRGDPGSRASQRQRAGRRERSFGPGWGPGGAGRPARSPCPVPGLKEPLGEVNAEGGGQGCAQASLGRRHWRASAARGCGRRWRCRPPPATRRPGRRD